ncbi:hypothetical protein NsoK4_00290 [Nitrosopumilus sp. K4]|uniref:hypothetical protein n=1 Tax=Nitrosopumilus sp. K4 TaxID=2795383 RepID=UPI001BA9BB64|nr:hypothetical protein [Nitrosopumilus sp. K4]QUC64768.1 hypothetical protein NsoK4_00290 [Nitrosopumilus sp. K4]
MENKSEDYFKKYLKNVTKEQLTQFYEDVEWTPFPVLVIEEYQRRFDIQDKKEAAKKLKIAQLAKEKTRELRTLAKKRGSDVSKILRTESGKISKSVENTKRLVNSEKNLLILEKLGELNKKGIISNKEFQDKKKEILKRI